MKGRSEDEEATKILSDALMCKWMNVTPMELKRMPYRELQKYKLAFESIAKNKPELLMGL